MDSKLLWACRRGMLELDLLLIPFAQQRFAQLSDKQQQAFLGLLEESDQNLYNMLVVKQTSPEPEWREIVKLIGEFNFAL